MNTEEDTFRILQRPSFIEMRATIINEGSTYPKVYAMLLNAGWTLKEYSITYARAYPEHMGTGQTEEAWAQYILDTYTDALGHDVT